MLDEYSLSDSPSTGVTNHSDSAALMTGGNESIRKSISTPWLMPGGSWRGRLSVYQAHNG